ncbi:MAG: peptidase inhibitor I78 [Caulobacteraceae bacterium]|nr:I78 family peptidase inhibitor [Caulobacter sp.]RYF89744.1 MAG: peptidase inhibitor I78 [Caulobacteraceae bacterium]
MKTVQTAVSVLGLMALFACATPEPEPAPAQPPPRVEAPRPMPSQEPKDSCGAKALQSLIGKPRSEIPVPVDPTKRRVTCTSCPVTMDYNPQRLNILFDADTGIIKDVKCG